MFVKEYISCDVHELANLIKKREINAKEALVCALVRIDEVNPSLNAIVTECSDFAQQCLSQLRGDEPYYGVPLLVKDLGHGLEGIRLTNGSRFFADFTAPATSDLVSKLMSLGFIPFAKTNTPELGLSYVTESKLFGPCRNPFDLNRTPGGSSGGSAAAIASGIAPIATASDGGGSIRIPAACCGLFGFKPTTGLIPSGPWVDELWSGLATNFVLARSIRDTVAMFGELTQPTKPIPVIKKPLNITYLEGAFAPVAIDAPYMEAVKQVEILLKAAGHEVNKIHLALDLVGIGDCGLTMIAANTYAVVQFQEQKIGRKPRKEELEPITWELYQRGKGVMAHELINARNTLYQLVRPLHQLFQQTDVVLTPALAQLPLAIGELSTDDEFNSYLQKNTAFSPFTSLFNQAGLPAMTLPVAAYNQLPISIQMGAAKGNDSLLLSLATELEAMLSEIVLSNQFSQ